MSKKPNKINKAIEIVQDNYSMLNSLLSPEELKVFGGDFAGYVQNCLKVCQQGKTMSLEKEDSICRDCVYRKGCGSPHRKAPCTGYQKESGKETEYEEKA